MYFLVAAQHFEARYVGCVKSEDQQIMERKETSGKERAK
jgi:hypothetical protein